MSRTIKIMSLLSLFLLCFIGCEYDGPKAVWSPNPTGDPVPVITTVAPPGEAIAGVAKIKIMGENFSPIFEENQVFFNNVEVDLKTCSETELSVYRPNLVNDDVTIRVVVRKALQDAELPSYGVAETTEKISDIRDLGTFNTIVVDHNENVFIHTNKKEYYELQDNGDFEKVMSTLPRSVYDLKLGPDNVVYVGRDDKYLMKAIPGETAFVKWAQGLPAKVKYIDFDENLNIYAGGKRSGIVIVHPDESSVALGGYEQHDIVGVRIYNGDLYVAAFYLGENGLGDDGLDLPFGIYRHKINSDGTLGERETFVDWSQTGSFAETTFSDFEFDEDGILLVATDGGVGNDLDPMMMVYPDGSIDTFYKGGILTGPILGMAWGENETLYFVKPSDNIYTLHKMGMAKRCAPRYGRES